MFAEGLFMMVYIQTIFKKPETWIVFSDGHIIENLYRDMMREKMSGRNGSGYAYQVLEDYIDDEVLNIIKVDYNTNETDVSDDDGILIEVSKKYGEDYVYYDSIYL